MFVFHKEIWVINVESEPDGYQLINSSMTVNVIKLTNLTHELLAPLTL